MDDCQNERILPRRVPLMQPNPKQAYGDRKVPLWLLPPGALIPIAMALKQGAEKYGPFNWRHSPIEMMTYASALERHLFAWKDREDIDPESNVHHLAHLGAGTMILLESVMLGIAIDNRPPRGGAADLLRRYAQPA